MKSTLRDRNFLIYQITIAGISIALEALFLLLNYFIPVFELAILLFVPFLACLVSIKCKTSGRLLLIFGTAAISFIDIQSGFFTLLPSSIIGVVFGLSVKKVGLNIVSFFALLSVSFLTQYILIYPINFFFEVDLIEVYSKIFSLETEKFKLVFPLFYLLISCVSSLIIFLVTESEITKFKSVKYPQIKHEPVWILSIYAFFLVLFIIFETLSIKSWAMFALSYHLIATCYVISITFKKHWKYYIIYCTDLIICTVVFAVCSAFQFPILGGEIVCIINVIIYLTMLKYTCRLYVAPIKKEEIDLLKEDNNNG